VLQIAGIGLVGTPPPTVFGTVGPLVGVTLAIALSAQYRTRGPRHLRRRCRCVRSYRTRSTIRCPRRRACALPPPDVCVRRDSLRRVCRRARERPHRESRTVARVEHRADAVLARRDVSLGARPNDKDNPAGKLPEAEPHFTDGVLDGPQADCFSIWERRRGGGRNLTFPSRAYVVSGDHRSFALLRPIGDATAQRHVRDRIPESWVDFMMRFELGLESQTPSAHRPAHSPSPTHTSLAD
jgi:hypothetical protein